MSNPKFEYWLLLHFENNKLVNCNNCSTRLKRHLPNYDKGIDFSKFTEAKIRDAISRAKQRNTPPCTTVYKLVENILDGKF